LTKFFAKPVVRLVARAVLAAVVVFVTTLQTSTSIDKAAVLAAGTAAFWAFVEAYTPLNQLVGKFKPKA
jgi:hypothetical protein